MKNPVGRQSEFTQEVADMICLRIGEGESLRAICRDDDTPAMSTVFKWLTQQPDFAEQYARARESQADALADEITLIADTEDDPNRARVRIDARKWLAGKMRPKKYGEKIQQEVTGADGSPLVFQTIYEQPKSH